ncbi:MAG: alcohol dehydrogenase catalytic domain-containing protein [Acidimicrobiia bacterium]|nr:alcohol dehydrogenase catalytic domain-containing protein [Acidimicrobiia bacterium]
MKAVAVASDGKPEVIEVAEPGPPGPGEVVVAVELAGICGTDLHVLRGDFGAAPPGTILGHEFVGCIVAVGSGVTRLLAGDRVVNSDYTACGHCRWCRRAGHWHCDERRFFGTGELFGPAQAGAQAERVLVPNAETTLSLLDPRCPPEAAILLSDNLATAWSAVERARLEPGEVVAVIGGGPVGLLSAHCALAVGAGSVVVVEPNPARRSVAASQGAVATDPDNARATVDGLTGGDGADVVIEAVGLIATLDSAVDLVRRGGRVASVGVPSAGTWTVPVAKAFSDELTLSFVVGNPISTNDRLQRMVIGGALDPTFVIDGRTTLAEAPTAYEAAMAQRHLKVVLEVGR